MIVTTPPGSGADAGGNVTEAFSGEKTVGLGRSRIFCSCCVLTYLGTSIRRRMAATKKKVSNKHQIGEGLTGAEHLEYAVDVVSVRSRG